MFYMLITFSETLVIVTQLTICFKAQGSGLEKRPFGMISSERIFIMFHVASSLKDFFKELSKTLGSWNSIGSELTRAIFVYQGMVERNHLMLNNNNKILKNAQLLIIEKRVSYAQISVIKALSILSKF